MHPLSITANKQGRDISLRNEFLNWLSPENRGLALNLEKTYYVKVRRLDRIKNSVKWKNAYSVYPY